MTAQMWSLPTAMGLVEFQEILKQSHAMLGGDTLGVELDAPNRQLTVAESHDLAFSRLSRDLEFRGKSASLDKQRMVAGAGKTLGQAFEYVRGLMEDG